MRKKQGLLIIMDGLGDRPDPVLGGMTPLESASTPNMERLLQMGMCGNVYPIAPGIPVGTDVGHLQIFGYDSSRVYRRQGTLRGQQRRAGADGRGRGVQRKFCNRYRGYGGGGPQSRANQPGYGVSGTGCKRHGAV